MPIPFVLVCDLLDECHRLCVANRPNTEAVATWFAKHRARIDAHDTDLAALLSALLPEKRADRVYCIKAPTLERIVGRALMLGSSRIVELASYKRPGQATDLADCVERILTATPNPSYNAESRVTVEEIDEVLNSLASNVKWSSPSIGNTQSTMTGRTRCALEHVYRRLSAREAKWFTRLVLKDYQPLVLDPQLVYQCCNSTLPLILKAQEDFATAIQTLNTAKGTILPNSVRSTAPRTRMLAAAKPKLGVKVGRQKWCKGRSIKHCLDMGYGRMSVEHKVDGEYCQIHIDATGMQPRIQIFSKSGKDSTQDKCKLHGVIINSLGFGTSRCNVKRDCILEGELVVYDDVENKIMPFHKIRKHVARRGRLMGVEMDSPTRWYEHLMIVYFDILHLDGQSLLGLRHSERYKILTQTINCEKGRAEVVRRTLIDFSRRTAASELRKAFANIITRKGEGLVLKPDEPYLDPHGKEGRCSGLCIKLKKEYIGRFGDVGDFAVVGAGFNPAKSRSYNIPNCQWTVFFVGCLNNKEKVKRWDAKPDFTVVSAVEIPDALRRSFGSHYNPLPTSLDRNDAIKLHIPKGIEADAPLTVVFQNPAVFDLRCFAFDKPGNMGFWTLRFPAVSKVHFDRDYSDTITFSELQHMAKEAMAAAEPEDSQENLQWIARLEGADPRKCAVDAVSQLTPTTIHSPSPRCLSVHLPLMAHQSFSTTPEMARAHSGSHRSDPSSNATCTNQPTSSYVENKMPTPERVSELKVPASFIPNTRSTPEPRPSIQESRESFTVATQLNESQGSKGGTCRMLSNTPFDAEPQDTGRSTQTEAQVCQFAGSKCHLLEHAILLATKALCPSSEWTALLSAHGALKSAVALDDWSRESMHTFSNASPRTIILVDTVTKANETRTVLAEMEQARKALPLKIRHWIAVYDWRVLGHLKIMEDEANRKKYFDGFHDPWRRWYCGIV